MKNRAQDADGESASDDEHTARPPMASDGALAVDAKRHPELVLAIGEVMRIAGALGMTRTLPPVLTIDEVAQVLNLDRKTVFRCIARRQLPGVRRFGKAVRISTEALMGWMGRGRGEPTK